MNDQSKPHRNAGEVMPEGISALLAEVGPLDGRDLFLDIGAGIGNVVAQVALGTTVYQAIGIELREDIHSLGAEMMCKARTQQDYVSVPRSSAMTSLLCLLRTLHRSLTQRLSTGTTCSSTLLLLSTSKTSSAE